MPGKMLASSCCRKRAMRLSRSRLSRGRVRKRSSENELRRNSPSVRGRLMKNPRGKYFLDYTRKRGRSGFGNRASGFGNRGFGLRQIGLRQEWAVTDPLPFESQRFTGLTQVGFLGRSPEPESRSPEPEAPRLPHVSVAAAFSRARAARWRLGIRVCR